MILCFSCLQSSNQAGHRRNFPIQAFSNYCCRIEEKSKKYAEIARLYALDTLGRSI